MRADASGKRQLTFAPMYTDGMLVARWQVYCSRAQAKPGARLRYICLRRRPKMNGAHCAAKIQELLPDDREIKGSRVGLR